MLEISEQESHVLYIR